MADDIVVDVSFKGNATDFLATLSRAVGTAKQQLQEMGQSTAALSRLETQLARMSGQARQFQQAAGQATTATRGWAQAWTPFKGQFQEADAASKNLWKGIDAGLKSSEQGYMRARQAVADFNTAQAATAFSNSKSTPMAEWDKEFQQLSRSADANTQKIRQAQQAIQDYQNSLSNTRYVLYDVAGTLTILGAGLIAPITAAVLVAANMEKAFAQVARTSGVLGSELDALKADFDNLYGAIPITYDALAQIATLAGQLGVPANQIAGFTEVVAKTAAVTDLSVEQAATAFGRLNALIPNVKGQYDRLGSAIATVGVNSVATESEIVNISTQISSMGAFAGLTAQDIVGLSGALASIGAQPELSRGTVTRVFTLMSRAVADGGESLEQFSKLSGVSASQFAGTWGTPAFSQTFLGFMRGIKDEGGNAVAALNELGITSVRDVPLLLRLANAADSTGQAGALLAQTMGDANKGWAENIELQRQYEIISSTVAARFEVLTNNVNLLLQAIGGPLLEGLGEFLVFLTEITQGVTEFAKSDFGGSVIRVTLAISALLGVLAIAGGALALMGAASIGVYQALTLVSAAAPWASRGLLGTAGAAALADGSLKAGAASATLFGRALRAISIVGIITLLPDILNSVNSEFQKMRGIDLSSASSALKEIATSGDGLAAYFRTNGSIAKNFASDIANSFTGVGVTVKAANEALGKMATDGNFEGIAEELNAFNKAATDVDAGRVLDMFPDIAKAAQDAGVELRIVGDEIFAVGGKSSGAQNATNSMSERLEEAAEAADLATQSLQEYKDALDAINGTQISAAEAADRLQSAINKGWEAVASGEASIDGTNDASIAFRDTLRDIEGTARDAGTALLENGGSTEGAMAKWNEGRQSIINMLTDMGKTPEEAQAMADAMFGTAAQMNQAFAAITSGLAAVPSSKTVTMYADTAYATSTIESWVARMSNKTITIGTYTYTVAGRGDAEWTGPGRANGGPVFGPGTSTSDSIITALSNGEYVIRTAAAKALGYGRLDYLNRTGKLPAFASGGMVGGSGPTNVAFPNSMMTEMSPTDRAIMSRRNTEPVQVQVSVAEMARKVNEYNARQAKKGN